MNININKYVCNDLFNSIMLIYLKKIENKILFNSVLEELSMIEKVNTYIYINKNKKLSVLTDYNINNKIHNMIDKYIFKNGIQLYNFEKWCINTGMPPLI